MDPDVVWDGEWDLSSGGVLDGVVIVERGWTVFMVNLGHHIVTSGDFARWLFPNYFGQDLFLMCDGVPNAGWVG